MPYLLLVIGLIIGIFALYRFFINANIEQIKSFFLASITITICVALFFMAVTGRLPAAIALVSALAPFVVAYYSKRMRQKKHGDSSNPDTQKPMTRQEALEVLGLDENADEKAIKEAYKKLMKKFHPDQEGSDWMASKLNEAKDLLLKK